MEKTNLTIEQLKERLDALPRNQNGKIIQVTDELRQTAVLVFKESDLIVKDFCTQIGVSYSAFNRWLRDFESKALFQSQSLGFCKLEIEPSKSTFVIEGPRGLRISGLKILDVSALWRSLC